MLLNAPHKATKVKYVNTPPSHITILYGNPGALFPSPDDDFEFEISPLSPRDTPHRQRHYLRKPPRQRKTNLRLPRRRPSHFTTNPYFLPTTKLKLAPSFVFSPGILHQPSAHATSPRKTHHLDPTGRLRLRARSMFLVFRCAYVSASRLHFWSSFR